MSESERKIKRMPELLQNIAAGINALTKRRKNAAHVQEDFCLGSIEVAFHCESGQSFEFGLAEALDALAEDLHWDERGDWSDAVTAEVRVI